MRMSFVIILRCLIFPVLTLVAPLLMCRASAQTCETLFGRRATTVFEIASLNGPKLGSVENVIRWQHQLVRMSRPFYLASHTKIEEQGATTAEYFRLNLQARASLIQELNEMTRGRSANSPIRKSIEHHLRLLQFSASMQLEFDTFLNEQGTTLLKDVKDDLSFRRLDGRMLSPAHGAIGEVMGAMLTNPRAVNLSIAAILGDKRFERTGLDKNFGAMEIDLVMPRTSDVPNESWGEIKFSLSRSFLTAGKAQRILEQADRVREVRRALAKTGKSSPNQIIFLIHPHVTDYLVDQLSALGVQVVVIDPITPMIAPRL